MRRCFPPRFPIMAAAVFFAGCLQDAVQPSAPPLVERNAGFPSAKVINARLGKGVNLGNALDAPAEGSWGVTLKADYFRAIADSGFATVRLPVRWSNHALGGPPYTLDSVFLHRVIWAVDEAIKNGLNVVLDMHHYLPLMENPAAEKARFLAMWGQIAKAFEAYPPGLVFDILNEPNEALDAATWNEYLKAAIDTIRTIQPRRSLMVGTSPWGGIEGLGRLELPEDSNLIVTVHYYAPHSFTHQGADFEVGADTSFRSTWRATLAQRAQIDQDMQIIKAWSEEKNRPIYIGEFGTYFKADTLSRALYTEYLASRFQEHGFTWAIWNFSSDFGLMDDSTGQWRGYLMQALLRPGHNPYLDSVLKASQSLDLSEYLIMDDFEDSVEVMPHSAWLWLQKLGKPASASSADWYSFYSDTSALLAPDGERILQWFETGDTLLPSNFPQGIGDWGYQGRGLHFKARIQGGNYPWVGFGAGILGGYDSTFIDLTHLTAIQFRAKGRGEWMMQVPSDSITNDYAPEENWGQMCVSFTLKKDWETYTFPVELLAPKRYSRQEKEKLTWQAVRDKIIGLEFMNGQSYGQAPNDSLEIWLDDIRLIGVQAQDFGL